MSEFKGTKGKWVVKDVLISSVNGVQRKGIYLENKQGFFDKSICKINCNNDYALKEYEANALLISKSTEMLEQHENDLKELQLLHDFIFNDQGYSITNPNLIWIEKAIEIKKQLIKQATEL